MLHVPIHNYSCFVQFHTFNANQKCIITTQNVTFLSLLLVIFFHETDTTKKALPKLQDSFSDYYNTPSRMFIFRLTLNHIPCL